jgi:coproporphyrinogen III oxidase
MISKEQIATDYKEIQDEICAALEITDGKGTFEEELWEREGGGGGRTRIIQNGNIFEKGGSTFRPFMAIYPTPLKKPLMLSKTIFLPPEYQL